MIVMLHVVTDWSHEWSAWTHIAPTAVQSLQVPKFAPHYFSMFFIEFCHRTCHPSPRWRCSAVSVWQIATEVLEGLHEEGAEMRPHPDQTQHLGAGRVSCRGCTSHQAISFAYQYAAVCCSMLQYALPYFHIFPLSFRGCGRVACASVSVRITSHYAVVCRPMDALTTNCKPNLPKVPQVLWANDTLMVSEKASIQPGHMFFQTCYSCWHCWIGGLRRSLPRAYQSHAPQRRAINHNRGSWEL